MKQYKFKEEMIGHFRSYLIEEEKAQATVQKYIRDVQSFWDFLSGKAKVQERGGRTVSKDKVISYKEQLIGHFKPASVNSMLAALNLSLIHI